jgi:hypothetical protein
MLMRFKAVKISNRRRQIRAFGKMTGRMPVPFHSIFIQRKIDHRTKK